MDFNVSHKILMEVINTRRIKHEPNNDKDSYDTYDICKDVGILILEHGSSVHVATFSAFPYGYRCCIADHRPRPHLGTVSEMQRDEEENWGGEWFIDPWMNISCSYKDFPRKLGTVADRWSSEYNRVVMPGSMRGLAELPDKFFGLLLNSRMEVRSYFSEYRSQFESRDTRLLKTKSAATRVYPATDESM